MYSPPSYQRVPPSIDIPLEDRYKPQPIPDATHQEEEVEAGGSSLKPTRYVYSPERPITGPVISVLADPAVNVDVVMRTIRQNFDLIDHLPDERLELYADDARILDSTWKYLVRHPPETVRVKVRLNDEDRAVIVQQDKKHRRDGFKAFGCLFLGALVFTLTLVSILIKIGDGKNRMGSSPAQQITGVP